MKTTLEAARPTLRPIDPESFSPWDLFINYYSTALSALLGPLAAGQPDTYALFVLRTRGDTMRPLEVKGVERYVHSTEVRQVYGAVMRDAILRDIATRYGELSPADIFRYELLGPDARTRELCREVRMQKIVSGTLSPREVSHYEAIAPPYEGVREIRQQYTPLTIGVEV